MGSHFRYPLIVLSIIILFAPLRFNLITQPAYKTLANSMPSISTTEQEALEAGTSWWEKNYLWGHPIGLNLKIPLPNLVSRRTKFYRQ